MTADQEALETANFELNHQVLDALLESLRDTNDGIRSIRLFIVYLATELGISEDRIDELFEKAATQTKKRRLTELHEQGEL